MAGFRKAKAEQAALKAGFYGASGRGKTLTALIVAEGLAKMLRKRVAFIDTERGTDFYTKDVPERRVHPKAFDFDAIYTRSITDILQAVKEIDPAVYGVVVVDSITHVWEACQAAYKGKKNANGALPIYAWGQIKKPYKDLMAILLSSPLHVIICGREGTQFEEDEDTGEMKAVGKKMKAEGETPYEPHILINFSTDRDRDGNTIHEAYVEKDRTGKLNGKTIRLWPSDKTAFELIAGPILPLLGGEQAKIESEDDHAVKDADKLAEQEQAKIKQSEQLLGDFSARIRLARTVADLKALGKEITPELKKQMTQSDVAELRTAYQEAEGRLTSGQLYTQEEVA